MKRKGSHRSVDEREESESSSHMVSKAAICWDSKTALDSIPQPMSGVAKAIRNFGLLNQSDSSSEDQVPNNMHSPSLSQHSVEMTAKTNVQPDSPKRTRLVWRPSLIKRFDTAVASLGDDATPRAIQKLMNVEGLTREQIASRLQKHRQKRKLQSESPQLMSGCEGWEYNGRAPRELVGPTIESAAVYKIASQAAQGIPTPVYPATFGTTTGVPVNSTQGYRSQRLASKRVPHLEKDCAPPTAKRFKCENTIRMQHLCAQFKYPEMPPPGQIHRRARQQLASVVPGQHFSHGLDIAPLDISASVTGRAVDAVGVMPKNGLAANLTNQNRSDLHRLAASLPVALKDLVLFLLPQNNPSAADLTIPQFGPSSINSPHHPHIFPTDATPESLQTEGPSSCRSQGQTFAKTSDCPVRLFKPPKAKTLRKFKARRKSEPVRAF